MLEMFEMLNSISIIWVHREKQLRADVSERLTTFNNYICMYQNLKAQKNDILPLTNFFDKEKLIERTFSFILRHWKFLKSNLYILCENVHFLML